MHYCYLLAQRMEFAGYKLFNTAIFNLFRLKPPLQKMSVLCFGAFFDYGTILKQFFGHGKLRTQ